MENFLILTKDFILNSFRSKRAVIFLILYMAIFLLITHGFVQIQAQIDSQMKTFGVAEQNKNMIMKMAKGVLKAQADSDIVDYLLSVPFLNIALALVSLFGTPILIAIWKYDLIAQEAYDKTLRFLLFRVSRMKILIAKYVSSVVEILGVTLIALLAGIIWAWIKLPDFDVQKSFSAGIQFLLPSQLFFSVVIAFTLMLSVIVKKPFTALLFSYLGMMLLAIIPQWVKYLSPFDGKYIGGLIGGISPEFFFSIFMYLLFTALFLGGAYLIFRRRDY